MASCQGGHDLKKWLQARFWWIHWLALVNEGDTSLSASPSAELLQKPIWTCQKDSTSCFDNFCALVLSHPRCFLAFCMRSFIKYTFLNVKARCSLSHRHDIIWDLFKKNSQARPVCLAIAVRACVALDLWEEKNNSCTKYSTLVESF